MSLHEPLALLLLLLQLAQAAPVIDRLWQRHDGRGVSLVTEAIWSMSGFGWLVVGYQEQSWPLAVSGLLAIACSGTVVMLVLPSQHLASRRRAAFAALATGAALGVAQVIGGRAATAAVLMVAAVCQFLPKIHASVHALRCRRPTSAVSLMGSTLRALYAAGWAVWAFFGPIWSAATSMAALIIWGVVGTITYGLQALAAGANLRPPKDGLTSSAGDSRRRARAGGLPVRALP